MAKHTPGPWTVGSQVMGDGFNLWADSTGGVVAWIEPRRNREDEETGEMVVDPPDMTQHPDARLIAAAPDLLARLRLRVEQCGCCGDADFAVDVACEECIADRAAIAKAEGRG